MKALVVYESFFGNTEKVAQAIGEGLGAQEQVEIRRVGEVESEHLTDLTLLVVGSPTRAFHAAPSIGAFLRTLDANRLDNVKVAAFDTRIATSDIKSAPLRFLVNFFGYAAEPIAKKLAKKGGQPLVEPEGFMVSDTEGPLKEGEIERARQWGQRIAAKAAS